MRNIFLLCMFLISFAAGAQTPAQPPINFYTLQAQFYATHPEVSRLHRQNTEESNTAEEENNEEEKYKDDEVARFKRWEAFMEPRVYPSGNFIDPGILLREFKKYQQVHPSAVRTANWQGIGPDLVPTGVPLAGIGRINTIAINPVDTNIIFAGTPCGGLWKSTNGGLNWNTNNSDLLPNISIGDIAINPIHPDTMYAATGDSYGYEIYAFAIGYFWGGTYSAGLMKSTDGGQSWNSTGLSYDQTDGQLIYRVVVSPANPNLLFAATRGGLYKSADAAATWTKVVNGFFFDVEFNAGNPNTVYAVDDHHCFVSTNGGSTWTQSIAMLQDAGTGSRISIAVTPANSNLIYVWTQAGSFYVSPDGGISFNEMSSPASLASSQGVYDIVLAASPTNANMVVAGGVNLVRSVNGGQSWDIIGGGYSFGADKIHPDFHAAVYYPNDGTRLLAGNDGGIFRSTQGSFPWTDISKGMAIKQYYRIGNSVVDHDYILAGAQDNGTDKFDGVSWTHVYSGDGMQPLVDYENDQVNYASAQYGSVGRSSNGSAGYSSIYPVDPGGEYYYYGDWVTPYVLDPLNHHVIYYGGAAYSTSNNAYFGTILKSENDGASWAQILTADVGVQSIIYRVRIAPSDPNTIYATTINQVFYTSNGGNTWSEITGSLPAITGGITDLVISNDDPKKIWLTFSGYTAGEKIYHSTNAGANWSNLSGSLPNIPANCIAYQRNANDMLYAGTDFGVFYRDNNMSDWEPFNDGLPNVIVTQLDVLYSFNKLRAATYGRGIWESDLAVSAVTANDAGILTLLTPAGFSCETEGDITARIKNFGTTTLTSVTLHMSVDNGAEQTVDWTGNLASGDTLTIDFGMVNFADGNHEIVVYTSNPNGAADENTDNDRRSGFYQVTISASTLPIAEGFESGFPPALWHQNGNMWTLANVGGLMLSAHSTVVPFFDIPAGTSELVTPQLSLFTSLPALAMTFYRSYAPYTDPGYIDTMRILITTDCFSTYTIAYEKTTPDLKTASPTQNPFVPQNQAQWKKDSIDLTAYIGMTDVQIAMQALSGYGNNLYIDDININPIFTGTIDPESVQFEMFPNPTHGVCNIILPSNHEVHSIQITNAIGSLIWQVNEKVAHASTIAVDLSGYAAGVYFVKLDTKNGPVIKPLVLE
ncbi:MAG: T9SS type A sorting domain-containing protein [Chitinophagales bacterium]